MNCRRVEQILLDGEYDILTEESLALENHLRDCSSCRQLQQATNLVRRQTPSLEKHPIAGGITDLLLTHVKAYDVNGIPVTDIAAEVD